MSIPCHDCIMKVTAVLMRSCRADVDMQYWGGANADGRNCMCGETSSCFKPSKPCNCDANDNVLRQDAGYVTNKPDLPITAFYAGDTGRIYILGIYPTPHRVK